MLEAGAETDVVNSVGRTAAQMAAFVGEFLWQFYMRLYTRFSPWKKYHLASQRTDTSCLLKRQTNKLFTAH